MILVLLAMIISSASSLLLQRIINSPTPLFGFTLKQLRSIGKFVRHDFFDNPLKIPKAFIDTTNSQKVLDASSIAPGEIKNHIEYGEMVQLAYDILNSNKTSRNYGGTHIGSDENLAKVVSSLFPGNKVETVIKTSAVDFTGAAATCESFMGYVLFNEKKREATIVFRGTILMEEWFTDTEVAGQIWGGDPAPTLQDALDLLIHPPVNTLVAHQGFYRMYTQEVAPTKLSEELLKREGEHCSDHHAYGDGPQESCRKTIGRLIKEGKIDTINTVGHSLGAALALVAAVDMGLFVNSVELKEYNWKGKVNAICYACPKVGTLPVINQYISDNRINFFHYLNRGDIVPTGPMPGMLAHPSNTVKRRFDPAKVDVIDREKTKALWYIHKDNLGAMHNLRHIMFNMWYTSSQVHEGNLDLKSIHMDKALLNWSDDMLAPSEKIPGNWHYKSIVKTFPEVAKGDIIPDESVDKFIELLALCRAFPAIVVASLVE